MSRNYQDCRCYYIGYLPNGHSSPVQRHLPLVKLQSKTTILSTCSTTTLTQTYANPEKAAIDQIQYTFPLYDGVCVTKFLCLVDDRTIKGRVKRRDQAKATYDKAVENGETAALLEQSFDAADVFTTTIGNIPAQAKVVIKITYIGELKQDAEIDGLRFTIPTAIAPRYGTYSGPEGTAMNNQGMEIIVDVSMPPGSTIKSIQSPSHSVRMSNTLSGSGQEPSLNTACATLTKGTTQLDRDFILQFSIKDVDIPKAILESHPTIPGQRALMASLVPRFSLGAETPEIIFCADRSGSMELNIPTLKAALKVMLKSMPLDVRFNICSFGSHHSFLWPKSKRYDASSLAQAMKHVETFDADFGGTETHKAVKACFESRCEDSSTELMLLTDGDIWQQEEFLKYIDKQVEKSNRDIRVFALGIGSHVSSSLIEGVARAGQGFAQFITDGERLDSKLVRMLKGALTPHISNYSMEVKYENNDTENDYEIVEKVSDSLHITLTIQEKTVDDTEQAPISLFANKDEFQKEEKAAESEDRWANLRPIAVPSLLQAPHKIPPLFSVHRTSVYLLMSPSTSHLVPKSVILRATSPKGPLQLEIPIQALEQPGETIHQLAARRLIQELEEDRGWVLYANDAETGKSLKSKFPRKMDQVVEREAVRLGVEFQVGGKWCSFVAVEDDGTETASVDVDRAASNPEPTGIALSPRACFSIGGAKRSRRMPSPPGGPQRKSAAYGSGHSQTPKPSALFGASARPQNISVGYAMASSCAMPPPAPSAFRAMPAPARSPRQASFSNFADGTLPESRDRFVSKAAHDSVEDEDEEMGFSMEGGGSKAPRPDVALMLRLIDSQAFSGYWPFKDKTWKKLVKDSGQVEKLAVAIAKKHNVKDDAGLQTLLNAYATAAVVHFFVKGLPNEEQTWELVVDKAKAWLKQNTVAAVLAEIEQSVALAVLS